MLIISPKKIKYKIKIEKERKISNDVSTYFSSRMVADATFHFGDWWSHISLVSEKICIYET